MLSSEFILQVNKPVTLQELAESYAKQIYVRHQLREQKLLRMLNETDRETVRFDFEKLKNLWATMKDFYYKLGALIHKKTDFNVDIYAQIDKWKNLMTEKFGGTTAEKYVNNALDKIADWSRKYAKSQNTQKWIGGILVLGLATAATFGASVPILALIAGVLAFINSFFMGETAGGSLLDGGKAGLITAILGSLVHAIPGIEHSAGGETLIEFFKKICSWVVNTFGEFGTHKAIHAADVGVTAAIARSHHNQDHKHT